MTYEETLAEWQETAIALKALTAREKALREGLFKGTFPDPVEGTNTYELPDGRKVKGVHKITRTLKADVLGQLVQEGKVPNEVAGAITRWKAELKVKEYKELPEDVRALLNACVESKPGMPTLEIVEAPKPDETIAAIAPA